MLIFKIYPAVVSMNLFPISKYWWHLKCIPVCVHEVVKNKMQVSETVYLCHFYRDTQSFSDTLNSIVPNISQKQTELYLILAVWWWIIREWPGYFSHSLCSTFSEHKSAAWTDVFWPINETENNYSFFIGPQTTLKKKRETEGNTRWTTPK